MLTDEDILRLWQDPSFAGKILKVKIFINKFC